MVRTSPVSPAGAAERLRRSAPQLLRRILLVDFECVEWIMIGIHCGGNQQDSRPSAWRPGEARFFRIVGPDLAAIVKAFIARRDCGLLDENGKARPARELWKGCFDLPIK
jgi:hypothetical protein